MPGEDPQFLLNVQLCPTVLFIPPQYSRSLKDMRHCRHPLVPLRPRPTLVKNVFVLASAREYLTRVRCSRFMSLRFPVLWEVANTSLVLAKMIAFLVEGVPFDEAWILLGLCSASIGLELVRRSRWTQWWLVLFLVSLCAPCRYHWSHGSLSRMDLE